MSKNPRYLHSENVGKIFNKKTFLMKKIILSVFVLTICLGSMAQKDPKVKATVTTTASPAKTIPVTVKTAGGPVFKNLLDSFSYMAGYNVATNMNQQGITELNTALMKKGIDDYLARKNSALDPAVGNKALQTFIGLCTEKKNAADKAKADADKAAGVAFLANNKKRKEVTTLADGLQYEIIKQGDSVAHKPTLIDTVVVNYIGSFIDGREFNNSYKSGQPAVFAVGKVIKGWSEVLQLMPVGSHWKVYLPTELAYDNDPPPGSGIAPGAVLVFDILLEGIKPVNVK
jgi:FKBP-type peptidyl-prolyl cis-trans isomerase FklB